MPNVKNILIIEDDRFIGEMYVRSLRNAGHAVDWVVSGKDGYEASIAKTYDVVLLDVMLPEKQGPEILSLLRSDEKDLIPNSRVIVLTNFEQDDASRMAMESKADGYLIKADITPRRLLEIIDGLWPI